MSPSPSLSSPSARVDTRRRGAAASRIGTLGAIQLRSTSSCRARRMALVRRSLSLSCKNVTPCIYDDVMSLTYARGYSGEHATTKLSPFAGEPHGHHFTDCCYSGLSDPCRLRAVTATYHAALS